MSTEHTAAQLTADDVLDLAQMAWDNGGIRESETRTIVVNSTLKRALTRCFVADAKYQEQTRNVGGVNLQTIETDFGLFNIMLDPYMPKDQLLVLSLEQLAPRFLEIPGKGHFFAEPLAKTGASDKVQLYGEEMRTRPGVAAQAFTLVSEQNADVRLITTSEVDISLLIADHDLPAVLEALQQHFEVE